MVFVDDKVREILSRLPSECPYIDYKFISAFRKMDLYTKEYLSFEQIQERKKEIEEIIRALYEGQV